jgi:hypothetical protein
MNSAVCTLSKGIGVTWLVTMWGAGRGKNRSWLLGTLIYKEVNLERWGRFVPGYK